MSERTLSPFNLKNKPQIYKIPSTLTEHLKFETQIIEWFDGFEKRQRFLLSKNKDGISQIAILLDNYNKLGLDPVRAIEWFIRKEILGVE